MIKQFFLVNSLVMTLVMGRATLVPSTMYYLQPGTPSSIQNFIKPEEGCNWTGVGGQVFDINGKPVTGLIVSISGVLSGQQILQYAMTGTSMQLGPGGFDITLSNHPESTQNSLMIQLLDGAGIPLISPLAITTSDQCEKNLIIINFRELPVYNRLLFPIVFKS
jgi:hypothetical protein